MKKTIYWILLVALLGVFGYSAYRIGDYIMQRHKSQSVISEAENYVTISEGVTVHKGGAVESGKISDLVEVNFDDLWKINEDVVAWLYQPDTNINYPVAQAGDNDYYLYRLLDGTWNGNGTLFLDYRNSSDFSDGNSIIYGHHMKTGDMFASLTKYKEQSYYDSHPFMYLTTPSQKFRVDFFAGCVVESNAAIYQSRSIASWLLDDYCSRSTFRPVDGINKDGPILTLSTCSFEFENARYVMLGALVPLSDADA